jgi:hypothetical protein
MNKIDGFSTNHKKARSNATRLKNTATFYNTGTESHGVNH